MMLQFVIFLALFLGFFRAVPCSKNVERFVKIKESSVNVGNMKISTCQKYFVDPYRRSDDIMNLKPSDFGIMAALGDSVSCINLYPFVIPFSVIFALPFYFISFLFYSYFNVFSLTR